MKAIIQAAPILLLCGLIISCDSQEEQEVVTQEEAGRLLTDETRSPLAEEEEIQNQLSEVDEHYPVTLEGCPADGSAIGGGWTRVAELIFFRARTIDNDANIKDIISQCRRCVDIDYQALNSNRLFDAAASTMEKGTQACVTGIPDLDRKLPSGTPF